MMFSILFHNMVILSTVLAVLQPIGAIPDNGLNSKIPSADKMKKDSNVEIVHGLTATAIETPLLEEQDAILQPNFLQTIYDGISSTDGQHELLRKRGLRTDKGSCNSTNYCHRNAKCVPNAAESLGYDCLCEEADGWTGDGIMVCSDYNECANADPHPCVLTENGGFCEDRDPNTSEMPAKFKCGCLPGFQPSAFGEHGPAVCSDKDECLLGTVVCDINADCVNVPGSYVCTCSEGYYGDGKTCTPVAAEPIVGAPCDTCVEGKEICGPDDFCICADGFYSPSGVGGECTDIPNCNNNNNNCDANAECQELDGSFLCFCNKGYIGNGVTCLDENECTLPGFDDGCDENAACVNLVGSWTCECLSGYEGSGTMCSDIDECASETDNCDENAACSNTFGSFNCTCNSGFVGDGILCLDQNECALKLDNCTESNKICVNTIGSFFCRNRPAPPPTRTATCGEGTYGNGLCPDASNCCSEYGWCGTSVEHCNGKTPAPTIFEATCGDGTYGNGVCLIATDCCSEFGHCGDTADHCNGKKPAPTQSGATCGGGSVGNNICPIVGDCCSGFGWCGSDAAFCG